MVRNLEDLKKDVDSHIRSIKDFPKQGINFRDIMPLLRQPALLSELCHSIAEKYKHSAVKVDAVAALEARGFLFGPQVAMLLGVPFVPIRKKGKLPGEVVRASYVKEYGEDVVEIQKDAFPNGAGILIADDLLATGGTLKAAVDLINNAGGHVVDCFVLIELVPLEGRKKVGGDTTITTLLEYPDA